ncbi:MAG: CHAT domain-containing protein [Bacteroidales bacterium]|nr:CHAT domain-containing protein [Bacteroidales bacterium]
MVCLSLSSFAPDSEASDLYKLQNENSSEKSALDEKQSVSLTKITCSVQRYASLNDTTGLLLLSDSLIKSVPDYYPDSLTLAEVYYYIGVCKSLVNRFEEAIVWLRSSVELKRTLGIKDDHFANGIFNLGVSYNLLGDYSQACIFWLEYIKETETLYGENNSGVAEAYSALIGASIEMKDFDKFSEYTFKVLNILGKNSNALYEIKLSNLYSTIGAGYARMGDYAKARIYLEKAESIIRQGHMIREQDYINLINSLAITYGSLGMTQRATEYFDQGIELAVSNNSFLAYNMINSYVIELGNSGRVQDGQDFLSGLVNKAESSYGNESRYYIEVLKNYADYLLKYANDLSKSLMLFSECLVYLNKHPEDIILRDQILIGYALALHKNGEFVRALEKIQELLFGGEVIYSGNDLYKNPGIDSLSVDQRTLRILQTKYSILWDIHNVSGEQKVLEAAAGTSELMISLIDKIRINVSEEESRMVLGSHFRESYLQAIRSFELCYRNSGERRFLEKAFEFAEKSKVAGLLAATRELNAIQFHIPPKAAEMEQAFQKEISTINSRISSEIEKGTPEKKLITSLNEKLLSVIKARDSLVMTFEKDYPEYYSIKYSTSVPSLKEIPAITGRNNNYLNYVMSDSLLYIFIINRKYQDIITFKTDSAFVSKLLKFRILLSNPSSSESARTQFNDFQKTGLDLYQLLIEPVRKYLISDNLMISPDNLLSYLPFETLLSSKYSGNEILYRNLPYLMNDYSISYVYSATFMLENIARNYSKTKDLIAFAPVYDKAINTDSLFLRRESGETLNPLPYSRQEAEYVSEITKGKLYLDNEARESTFKREAGRYDIIHLAMHTYLNDIYPMNSAMIFTQSSDAPEDGLLNTYEVYGIPLKARMVVLSSCKTGYGKLSSGEGILSLARGFLYSGSQSVVLSMWEIEDRSGTDIIKMFYDNLLKGKSKSSALKKARKDYLKQAGQLRSHPYFWSTLLIYGDNAPIYGQRKKLIMTLIALTLGAGLIYFLKRRYS